MEFGKKLYPEHSLTMACRMKGMRQKIIVIQNPGETDQNQLLLVRFPNLGSDNIIVPGTTNLSFNIKLCDWIEKLGNLLAEQKTFFWIDDIIARKTLNKQRKPLLGLEILGRHKVICYGC